MAVTSLAGVTSTICINPADAGTRFVTGIIPADVYPGQVVVRNSTGWVLADSDNVATNFDTTIQFGVVQYRARVDKNGTFKQIDDMIDVSEEITTGTGGKVYGSICLSGICWAFITDQGAAITAGRPLIPSATAGSLTVGSAIGAYATVASDIADDDTRALIGLGHFKGAIHQSNPA